MTAKAVTNAWSFQLPPRGSKVVSWLATNVSWSWEECVRTRFPWVRSYWRFRALRYLEWGSGASRPINRIMSRLRGWPNLSWYSQPQFRGRKPLLVVLTMCWPYCGSTKTRLTYSGTKGRFCPERGSFSAKTAATGTLPRNTRWTLVEISVTQIKSFSCNCRRIRLIWQSVLLCTSTAPSRSLNLNLKKSTASAYVQPPAVHHSTSCPTSRMALSSIRRSRHHAWPTVASMLWPTTCNYSPCLKPAGNPSPQSCTINCVPASSNHIYTQDPKTKKSLKKQS